MNKENEKIKQSYNRIAKNYDRLESFMEQAGMARWRDLIWQEARGRILEIGVGTGNNIPYYPRNAQITAVDFSEKMLEKAREKALTCGKSVDFQLMDIQNLAFPSDTFDTVISTCVFCSVPDPVQGLLEIKRVCKRDGQIMMLEHVRSRRPILGLFMDLLNPFAIRLIGDNINRDTVENLKSAGLNVDVEQDLMMDIVKRLQCHKS